ncbi:F-box/LRR-repeat protein 10 [Rhynchospora pubera]|uniref:F-box/LRR-repeat protein 10 n=1 Tax=Rhynchospora pubera TaxID=906938 RepID=A0AAV8F3B6_9POAL|nr:F-box/LRR-repeat protein 10 [Rhynchospora pubera]
MADSATASESPAIDHHLPSAVLATVLSHLDIRSLVFASTTCRAFRTCASQALSFLPTFHLLDFALTVDFLRPLLMDNPCLRSIWMDCSRLDDEAIKFIAKPSLNELYLVNCENLSGNILSELGTRCPDLRTLTLNSLAGCKGVPISFSDLEQFLIGCSELESLSLPELDFSVFDWPNFHHIWSLASQKLSCLEIGYIPMIMLSQILTLAVEAQNPQTRIAKAPLFPSLQKLCLSVDYITDNLVGSISEALPQLTHLDLQDAPWVDPTPLSDLTNAGLQLINRHGKLKHVSLIRSQEFMFTSFKRVSDLGLLLMAQTCSNLESISLGGFSRVTDAGFRAVIHSCSRLCKLRVSHGNQLTDLVFHDISATSLSLTHVSLKWCNLLTDMGVKRLSFNKDLNVLDLRECRLLSDEAISALSLLPKLQVLLLDGTGVTDIGLSYLGQGSSPLKSLSLRGCKRLTNSCVELLLAGEVKSSLQTLDLSKIHNLTDEAVISLARSHVKITELRLRECTHIGDSSIMALASMMVEGGTHGSSLHLLDLYECGGITPLAFRWFKKPYFPRLRSLGVTGCLNRDMVDALARSRPFLRVSCRGEELGTAVWGASSDWCRQEEDNLDELEQFLLEGEEMIEEDDDANDGDDVEFIEG